MRPSSSVSLCRCPHKWLLSLRPSCTAFAACKSKLAMRLLHIQLTPVQPIPAPSTRCSWKFRLFPSFLHVRKPEAWRTRARSCLHAAKSEKLPGCVLCKLNRTCAESDASFAFEANHRVPAHWPDPGASWRRCDPAYCRAFGSDSKVGASPAPRPPPPPPPAPPTSQEVSHRIADFGIIFFLFEPASQRIRMFRLQRRKTEDVCFRNMSGLG